MPGVVAVIGAAGRTGRHVVRLAHAAGYAVRGLVRTAEQAQAVQALGAVPVHGDLKGEWEAVLDGADAVVWCAGAGRDSTSTEIGRDALIAVARRLMTRGPRRLLVVSSKSADHPERVHPALGDALRAKAVSDAFVRDSGLEWTIVRPGGLTDEPGTGQVTVGVDLPGGKIAREDVAAVLVACLEDPRTVGQQFEVLGGEQAIAAALAHLSAR